MDLQPPADAGVYAATLQRYQEVMHSLSQLRQTTTTAAYTRAFYSIISGGTPGINDTTLKVMFLDGLRSSALRAALMQMPLRHMELWEVTDNACALAMQIDC